MDSVDGQCAACVQLDLGHLPLGEAVMAAAAAAAAAAAVVPVEAVGGSVAAAVAP